MADIVALMVRERLTGEPPPDGAKPLVDLLPRRDRGQGRRRPRPADRRPSRTRRPSPASPAPIIRDLELGDDLSDDARPGRRTTTATTAESPRRQRRRRGEGEDQDGEGAEPDDAESRRPREPTTPRQLSRGRRRTTGRRARPTTSSEIGDGEQPARPDLKDAGTARAALQGLHHRPRRGRRRRGAVRRRGADPAARLSRPAAGQPVQRGLAPGQPAAAQAAGPAEPLLELRPRGRACSTSRA